MNDSVNPLAILILLVIFAGLFFLVSYIFMLLWNSCVVKIAKKDTIQKISYQTSLGLVLMIGLFSSSSVVVYKNANVN